MSDLPWKSDCTEGSKIRIISKNPFRSPIFSFRRWLDLSSSGCCFCKVRARYAPSQHSNMHAHPVETNMIISSLSNYSDVPLCLIYGIWVWWWWRRPMWDHTRLQRESSLWGCSDIDSWHETTPSGPVPSFRPVRIIWYWPTKSDFSQQLYVV